MDQQFEQVNVMVFEHYKSNSEFYMHVGQQTYDTLLLYCLEDVTTRGVGVCAVSVMNGIVSPNILICRFMGRLSIANDLYAMAQSEIVLCPQIRRVFNQLMTG